MFFLKLDVAHDACGEIRFGFMDKYLANFARGFKKIFDGLKKGSIL